MIKLALSVMMVILCLIGISVFLILLLDDYVANKNRKR